MSQHADIAKHCLALAIKKNFTKKECLDNLNSTFCVAGYEEYAECPEHELKSWIERIILSQKDGLYGVSHAEVNEWMNNNMTESKIIYVIYEEDRGYGTTIIAAYTDEDKAQEHANQHCRYYYDAVELN